MRYRFKSASCAAIVCAAWMAPGTAAAQDAAPEAAVGETADQGNDIVVTAQRREERLRDVPISVTSLGGEALEAAGFDGTRDLTRVTPGLNFQPLGGAFQPTIRGVVNTSSTSENSVALYVDGVYRPNQLTNSLDIADIERIEVLKGPQGTLFGRNAAGGAINIFTKDPSFTSSGHAKIGYGRFNEVSGGLYLTGGLTDTLAANISLYGRDDRGYKRDLVSGGHTGDVTAYGARVKFLFEPNDDLRMLLMGAYNHREDNTVLSGQPYKGLATPSALGFLIPTEPNTVALNVDPFHKYNDYSLSLKLDYDLGFANFQSTSAYRSARAHILTDLDATPAIQSTGDLYYRDSSWSQEFILSSPGGEDSKFNWVTGLYIFEWNFDAYQETYTGNAATGFLVSSLASTFTHVDKISSIAPFAEATFEPVENLFLTGGIRYTHDTISYVGVSRSAASGATTSVAPRASFDFVTPRASIRYSPSEAVNAYFTWSRGAKSGQFAYSALATAPVRPEKVDSFEFGLKGELPGLYYSAALFYIDHKDLQVQAAGDTSLVTRLVNAGKVVSKGAEVELIARPVKGFSLRGNIAYTDATYKNFPGAATFIPLPSGANQAVVLDVSGNRVVRTPKITALLDAKYEAETSIGGIELSANLYHAGKSWFDLLNLLPYPSYTLLNLSASWKPTDSLKLTVYGENVTDKKYITGLQQSGTVTTVNFARPAMWGVRAEYSW